MKLIVGIDEVGRGPLAGPVSVGIVVLKPGFDYKVFGAFTDSKKMTESARERVYELAVSEQEKGTLRFGVYSRPAALIDEKGIVFALADCIRRGLTELAPDPADALVYLDGALSAPEAYKQKTVIQGDSLVPAISLASIVAKVERDRFMTTYAHTNHPEYGFDDHKGYGTAQHISAIQKIGLSPLHRATFCTSIVIPSAHDR